MPLWVRKNSILICLLLLGPVSYGQGFFSTPDSLNKPRRAINIAGQGTLYTSTLAALNFAWYSEYQNGKFHFFNDWPGWMQMDKFGHSAAAYQTASNLYRFNRWTGAQEKQSLWGAVAVGYSYQLAVEMLDGFSEGWGFSVHDVAFNTIGSGAFFLQQQLWKEQRVKIKFSFSPSGLTQEDEDGSNAIEVQRARRLFGTGIHEQWLKDYNGQTYWVSVNLWSALGKPNGFPKWLNVAVGHSVNNVLGAESNTWNIESLDQGTVLYSSPFQRQRQVLLSLDLDLDHVDLPKYLIWLRPVVGVIKIPFPSLEWNSGSGLRARAMYF